MRFQRADRPSLQGVPPAAAPQTPRFAPRAVSPGPPASPPRPRADISTPWADDLVLAPLKSGLALGAPRDPLEREAERVALRVAGPPTSSGSQSLSREKSTRVGALRPASSSFAGHEAVSPSLQASIREARGTGQPLPDPLRHEMEEAFGDMSFGGVRVHADSRSDHLNRLFHAKAFTAGQDVFFRQGAFHPDSSKGRALIAHELAHVVQQKQGPQPAGLIQRYMADDWARPDESLAAARSKRDSQRADLKGWTGADHVSGAVLEYLGNQGARKVTNLGSEVSGNPRSPEDKSFYERRTVLNVSANCMCSEKRILSKVPGTIMGLYVPPPRNPTLYLANEWTACGVCEERIDQLQKDVESLEVVVTAKGNYAGAENATTWNYAPAADGEQVYTLKPLDPASTREYKKPLKLAQKLPAKSQDGRSVFDVLADLEDVMDADDVVDVDEDAKDPAPRSRKKKKKKPQQAQQQALNQAVASSQANSARVAETGPAHTVTQPESAALESRTGLKLPPGAQIALVLLALIIIGYFVSTLS